MTQTVCLELMCDLNETLCSKNRSNKNCFYIRTLKDLSSSQIRNTYSVTTPPPPPYLLSKVVKRAYSCLRFITQKMSQRQRGTSQKRKSQTTRFIFHQKVTAVTAESRSRSRGPETRVGGGTSRSRWSCCYKIKLSRTH